MDRVSVGEEQPLATGVANRGGDRVVFSGPAFGERPRFNYLNFREALCDFAGSISGMIIDDDDFEIDTGLRNERFQAGSQRSLLVACGNDYRNPWSDR